MPTYDLQLLPFFNNHRRPSGVRQFNQTALAATEKKCWTETREGPFKMEAVRAGAVNIAVRPWK